MRNPLLLLVAVVSLALALPAQAPSAQGAPPDFKTREAELARGAAAALLSFASNARSQKVLSRAKQAYDQILAHYDADNAAARAALGFKKVKDKWELPAEEKRPKWDDKANNDQRYRVVDEWAKTARKLGDLHRQLGLEMVKANELQRGTFHLERAVFYNPFDKEAHLALGHKEANGFWGADEEVAFVKRMKEVETKALELAKREYPVQALAQEQLPVELKNTGFTFAGIKSEHFTIWTRGTQENADNCGKWAERGLDFLVFLIGEREAKNRAVAQHALPYKWIAYLWTEREREQFLQANKPVWEGKSFEAAKRFVNIDWKVDGGLASVAVKLTPAQMHDNLITLVFHYGIGAGHNEALSEGLQHAACWYLLSTSIEQFGALPEGTVAGKELRLPESTNWWLRYIRDQATAGTDVPINVVPRERLSSFRNDVRIKAWSFMTWVVSRYPDAWLNFFTKIPDKKVIMIEDVEQVGADAFGKKLAEVEDEWREWARGGSGVSAATGYGPPLLPEKPNKEEIAVLERMNECRKQAIGYVVTGKEPGKTDRDKDKGKDKDKDKGKDEKEEKRDQREGQMMPLPLVDLDAEASMACEDHAKYLTKWPEQHMKWPEAHEENPALEGFSPRGMRAGMRSVIVFANGDRGVDFARESVDGWIGTVYHRFPLLEHNINRFGYAYVYDNGWSVAVLDMGSLEEPYDPLKAPLFVAWPPPGMKNVPLKFHGNEFPNPLDDQPENERELARVGYPVSLQLQREFASQLGESDIALYEVRPGGKPGDRNLVSAAGASRPGETGKSDAEVLKQWQDRRKGASVPMYRHTPKEPLLKRMEERQVVFGIPKAHLEPSKTYQVEVSLTTSNPTMLFIWEFTTGIQSEGLKF